MWRKALKHTRTFQWFAHFKSINSIKDDNCSVLQTSSSHTEERICDTRFLFGCSKISETEFDENILQTEVAFMDIAS